MVLLWMAAETDPEEKKLLNKIIFFLAYKKYSCSFITLRINYWCHMDYFNDALTMFLGHKTFQLHCCL